MKPKLGDVKVRSHGFSSCSNSGVLPTCGVIKV